MHRYNITFKADFLSAAIIFEKVWTVKNTNCRFPRKGSKRHTQKLSTLSKSLPMQHWGVFLQASARYLAV